MGKKNKQKAKVPAATTAQVPASASTSTSTTRKGKEGDEFVYVENLSPEQHEKIRGRCVLVDPGSRDILYCMSEESTVDTQKTYRCTVNMYRKWHQVPEILDSLVSWREKPIEVIKAEKRLSKVTSNTSDPAEFDKYLRVMGEVSGVLTNFYSNPLFRSPEYIQRKLSARADKKLCGEIRMKFGTNPVLVVGDWSMDPAFKKGVEMCRMLRYHGFEIYLIDEFRTSIMCPYCFTDILQNPDELVPNPNTQIRHITPFVKRHGLLVCVNPECVAAISTNRSVNDDGADNGVVDDDETVDEVVDPSVAKENKRHNRKKNNKAGKAVEHDDSQNPAESSGAHEQSNNRAPVASSSRSTESAHNRETNKPKARFFNRNVAAVLNFRHILFSLRETGKVPERFTRSFPLPKARKLPPLLRKPSQYTATQKHNAQMRKNRSHRRDLERLEELTLQDDN